jgi:hypothetical protein
MSLSHSEAESRDLAHIYNCSDYTFVYASQGSSWLDLEFEVGVATTGVVTFSVGSITPCRLACRGSLRYV